MCMCTCLTFDACVASADAIFSSCKQLKQISLNGRCQNVTFKERALKGTDIRRKKKRKQFKIILIMRATNSLHSVNSTSSRNKKKNIYIYKTMKNILWKRERKIILISFNYPLIISLNYFSLELCVSFLIKNIIYL